MGCEVYANGDEISCKAGDGKVIAAFPDVCLSPPSPPAGPIPVPYPDTSFSKDMKNGSKTVKIKGKEVMLKDQSFYKTSPLGDEAATRGLGAGVITHVITGKTYFVAWSMDVKFEGQNVDRHMDLTTSNHASPMANEQLVMANLSTQAKRRIKRRKCPCCGDDPHSAAQREDLDRMKGGAPSKSISEEEFYGMLTSKEHKNDLAEIRANNDKCKLLPDKGTPPECNRYYPTKPKGKSPQGFDTPSENAALRSQFDNGPLKVKLQKKYPKAKKFAHKVPISAGGCPNNPNNLEPVEDPRCLELEEKLGKIHGNLAEKMRKR
jgi:hypothetical protein